jgi:hypothetical protein
MCLHHLDPLYSAAANAFITLLWMTASVLVSLRTFEMVKQPCPDAYYITATGFSTCVLYKVLYLGAACGM